MKQGINKVHFGGNIVEDAVLRHTQSGQAVLNIRIASNESYKTREGEKRESTEFMNATMWGNRAEALARYLTKGTAVYVEGRLRTSSYEGRDGQNRWKTEINVDDLKFLGGGNGGGGGGQRQQQTRPPQDTAPPAGDDLDDLPF